MEGRVENQKTWKEGPCRGLQVYWERRLLEEDVAIAKQDQCGDEDGAEEERLGVPVLITLWLFVKMFY